MAHNSLKPGYIPALDGLRGIAVLAVMAFHARFSFFQGGFLGVDVFFVLSGFLITTLLIKEYDAGKRIGLKNFYMRRVLRLAPALLLFLLVVVIISFLFLQKKQLYYSLVDVLIALFYMSNWSHAFNIHPPAFIGHIWTLSVEEQFYILWPLTFILLLKVIKSRGYIALIVLLAAISSWMLRIYLLSSGATIKRVYAGLDTRADTLLIGCFLAIVLSSNLMSLNARQRLSNALRYMAPLSAVLIIRFFVVQYWMSPRLYYVNFFVLEILIAIIILDIVISGQSMLKSMLSARPLVWFGGISYGVYLWHYPIYTYMFNIGFSKVGVFTLGSVFTLAAASASYYCLERPFLKLKSRWAPSKAAE